MAQQTTEFTPQRPQKSGKGARWILVAVALVLVLAGGALFVIGARKSKKVELVPSPSPTVSGADTASPAPSPSPAEKVDKTTIKIDILNGTGIPKEASLLQDELEKLGYSDIDAGNASDQAGDKKTTEVIFAKELSSSVVDEITKKLESLYQDVSTKTGSAGSYDVKITTGLRKNQTPKPEETATPTPKPSASTATSSGSVEH